MRGGVVWGVDGWMGLGWVGLEMRSGFWLVPYGVWVRVRVVGTGRGVGDGDGGDGGVGVVVWEGVAEGGCRFCYGER